MSDITMNAIHASLNGLSVRQRAVADNIANVQTPGYKAKRVSFENSLRGALEGGSTNVTPSVTRTTDYSRLDGNNVSLDTETLELVETNLRYSTMIEAMNAKFRLLRSAVQGG